MKRLALLLVSLILTVGSFFITSPLAHADTSHVFLNWEYDIEVQQDGWSDVTLNITADFRSSGAHGPYITFIQKQTLADDPDHYWVLEYDFQSITSPSGAPTRFQKEEEGNVVGLKIGQENRMVFGVQDYVVKYRVYGLVDPNNEVSGLDEFRFMALGGDGNMDYDNFKLTVKGPAAPTRIQCDYVRCESVINGDQAVFTASDIPNYAELSTVTGYPVGTFVGAEPKLIKRPNFGNMLTPSPLGIGGGIVVLIASAGAIASQIARNGRDSYYLGLTPGLTPVPGAAVQTSNKRRKVPVTVQFSPPRGSSPGQLGVLLDTSADNRDVTALIIGLTVAGYMKIERLSKSDWAFIRLPEPAHPKRPLTSAEAHLLNEFFSRREKITNEDLADESYRKLLPDTRKLLYKEVTKKGWFSKNPNQARHNTGLAGGMIIILGLLAAWGLGYLWGLGLWGVGLSLGGLLLIGLSGLMPARTAEGSAVLAQTKGFELFLRTADAETLRWEEGQDIFSEYLPYAIAFGCADIWAKTFEDLAAQGRFNMQPSWYSSYYPGSLSYGAISYSLTSSLSQSFSSAMAHASASAISSAVSSSGFGGGSSGGFGGTSGGSW